MSVLLPYFAEVTGLSEGKVRDALRTGPGSYRHFYVSKANGSRRLISAPPDDLKAIQSALVAYLRPRVSIHSAATAYQKGSSIHQNALRHAGGAAIRSYDFEDFFPSLVAEDWADYCARKSIFDCAEDVAVSVRVLFKDSEQRTAYNLAVGTPSAPFIANVLMYAFDAAVDQAVSDHGIRYTRYADDITFSATELSHFEIVDSALTKGLAACGCRNLRLTMPRKLGSTKQHQLFVTSTIPRGV